SSALCKKCFLILTSLILPFFQCPLLSPNKTLCGDTLHMLSLVCIAREGFLGGWGVHVISTGPISTVQTEVRGPASS
ncbi:unnamed protein product, partial [Staurois parvus]